MNKTIHRDHASSTHAAPTAALWERAAPARGPSLSSVIRRADDDPRSLTHADAAALQRTIGNAAVSQLAARAARQENRTGLPDQLKAGIENLSGLAMDDVRVHYNSDKPATVQALAYAQAPDIHMAPGQEKHLPHEAWHVVQQKQGRVKPMLQLKGVAINDDGRLEREADVTGPMGSRSRAEAARYPTNFPSLVSSRLTPATRSSCRISCSLGGLRATALRHA